MNETNQIQNTFTENYKSIIISINGYSAEDDVTIIPDEAVEIVPIYGITKLAGRYVNYITHCQNFYNLLNTKERNDSFDITKYKTYYRYPNIALSRDKMDNVKEKYNIKKVLDINKADFKIIGLGTLKKLVSHDWGMSLSSPKNIRNIIEQCPTCFSDATKTKIENELNKYNEDACIYIDFSKRYNSNYLNGDISNVFDYISDLDRESISKIEGKANMEIFDSLINGTVISDTYMNELCSEDSIILNDESYKNIRDMLKGSKEDVTIAMSMMSNCNIVSSKTHLALLFFHFNDRLRGGSLWNQVGFTTLKHQFEKYIIEYNHYHSARYSKLIQLLIEDNALTESAHQHILNEVYKKVISSTGINTDLNVFSIDQSSIKLLPEFSNAIKKN